MDHLFLSFQAALAGRYSIDRELGRGGMGIVFLAREVHLDRLVAIKLLPPELAARNDLRERFLREAQLAARLSHPNIIPIHAVEETDGFVYYVMAFVEGETLAQRVQARGPLSGTEAIRVFREVAWALAHAHSQGIVHRDVKPDNIMLESATGRVLVADFGIAVVSNATQNDGISGTPDFMSPEQALGEPVDARSDVYALGASAFYAVSGHLPFDATTAADALSRRVVASAPSLASTGVPVPRKLAQVIDKCLARFSNDRPHSAQAVADELGVALEQRREMPAALRAFVRRNGRMDGAGTILGLFGGLAASVVTSAIAGGTAGVTVLVATFVAMPIAFSVNAARQLLQLGFTQADLTPAFRAELEASREERNLHVPSKWSIRSIAERMLQRGAEVFAALSVLGFILSSLSADPVDRAVLSAVAGLMMSMAVAAGLGFLAMVQTRRDVDNEFWNALWTGRFGTAAFAIARRLRGSKPVNRAMTHRATELSLGIAAVQLFESLPKADRASLGDLPALLEKLQHDAHTLRVRNEQLADALTQSSTGGADVHRDVLLEEQQLVQQRMREAVAALENIRLGLLRLHAGTQTLESLTTHVREASLLTADVNRLAQANEEVERLLEYPRPLEPTPA